MRKLTQVFSFIALALLTASQLQAKEAESTNAALKDKIQETIGLKVLSISPSPVNGLFQAMTQRGLFYISEDGKYFMQGRIFSVDDGMKNVTEEALAGARLDGIEGFSNDMIEFKAKDEKYVVTVFTDITCGYCRKLHDEMSAYNQRGITVRYLAFPRGGPNSPGFSEMESVWCSKDKQQAMTTAKGGDKVDPMSCENKVREQYDFGQQVGVTGTPAIVLADGTMLPGYQPAEQLEQILKPISEIL